MPIAFRAAAETAFSVAVDTVLTKPTGTVDGDLLIGAVAVTNGTSVTPPAGWAEYSNSPLVMGSFDLHAYWKRASSEGGSWTFTHASTGQYGAAFACSGGLASGDPNNASTPSGNTGTSTSVTATGITIDTPNSLGIILWSTTTDPGTPTPPDGFTEDGFFATSFGFEDKVYASPGATGDQVTAVTNSTTWAAYFIALKPAAGGAVDLFVGHIGEATIGGSLF